MPAGIDMQAEYLHTRFMNSAPTNKKTAKAKVRMETVPPCPACSHEKGFVVRMASVYECANCLALYGHLYLGDSYTYVLPRFSDDPAAALDRQRYFDFECLGSKGMTRRHGWFDPETKLITQVG